MTRDRNNPEYKRLMKLMAEARKESKRIGAGNPGYQESMDKWTAAWVEFHRSDPK
jgi:hypothetical protein